MKKLLLLFAALFSVAAPPVTLPPKPKLVVAIAVDQFRYDYLTRFRSEYKGGIARLLTRGAVFTSAFYEHFPTVTAVGHTTMLSGAAPSISGIIGNEWYDRDENRVVTSVTDSTVKILGGAGEGGASPRRLLVSTLGDELKMAGAGKPKVIGISLKDRSAILPSGHMADGAYWFDSASGNFVSTTFYFPDLPAWVKDFNANRPADRYAGSAWLDHKMPAAPGKLYAELAASPFGNDVVEAMAEHAIQAEQLGRRGVTDILTLSFSSNDYVGHHYGPDSPEVREMSIRTDRLFEKFFAYLDSQLGSDNVLVVMTADHGVAPLPEVQAGRRMPGGRVSPQDVRTAVQAAIEKRYGPGNWIIALTEHALYLNLELIARNNLDRAEVARTGAQAALAVPHVFRAYTRERLMDGAVMDDQAGRRVMNGYSARRGGDIVVLLEPYWMFSATGTTHSAIYSYDAHVPLIFMGAGIHPGVYPENVAVNDIAPTLAAILQVETPSGSAGRVLSEMF